MIPKVHRQNATRRHFSGTYRPCRERSIVPPHHREDDDAYLAAIPGEQYALCFPGGGSVDLDMEEVDGSFQVRWLRVLDAEWAESLTIEGGKRIELTPPDDRPRAAVLLRGE